MTYRLPPHPRTTTISASLFCPCQPPAPSLLCTTTTPLHPPGFTPALVHNQPQRLGDMFYLAAQVTSPIVLCYLSTSPCPLSLSVSPLFFFFLPLLFLPLSAHISLRRWEMALGAIAGDPLLLGCLLSFQISRILAFKCRKFTLNFPVPRLEV